MARQLFEPLRSRPGVGRVDGRRGGTGRARARTRGGRAGARGRRDARRRARARLAGQQPRANAARPCLSSTTSIGPTRRRCAGWRCWRARSASCGSACVCAVRSGEPAAAPELLAELLAGAPEPPVRPRALGPAATETLVRERLPAASPGFAHACHAVTGGNPFLLGALLTQLVADARRAGRRGRRAAGGVRVRAGRARRRAPARAAAGRRRGAGPRRRRARPRRSVAPRRRACPARARRGGPRRRRAAGRRPARRTVRG